MAILHIDSILKGTATAEILLDMPQPGAPVSSSDIVPESGQGGLWFLRRMDWPGDPVYTADHPQRFVPQSRSADRLPAIRHMLKD